jgi:hypothetical protein
MRRRREKGFNQIRVFNLGFEAGPLSVATGGPELGFPGTLPSTNRSHSLEFRVIKNVPFYESFGGGKSDWQAPLLYNGREKPSTQEIITNVSLFGLFFHYLKLGFLLCSPIELNNSII